MAGLPCIHAHASLEAVPCSGRAGPDGIRRGDERSFMLLQTYTKLLAIFDRRDRRRFFLLCMLMMAMGKTTAKVLQQMLCLGWELESFRGGV